MAAITAPPAPPPASTSCRLLRRRGPLIRFAASSSSSPSSRFRPSSSSSSFPGAAGSSSSSGGGGGEILHVSPPPPPAAPPGAPVYVTLPADAVGPGGRVARRRAMGASLAALAAAGVAGVAVELWWGVVERHRPGEYDWAGYLELAAMARRHGLRVRAILAFHQCGAGPHDHPWIPLPQWVLEEMDKIPDLSYTNRYQKRNKEYISLGCDILPVLKGRSPMQAYSDFMRSFRNTFEDYLGAIVTEVQVGMGPGGELRYPSCPTEKLNQPGSSSELGEFQCYDKGMKLLPMGRKSLFYLAIYGSVLGVGSYVVHYFSTLVSSILENFGLSEELYNPVSIFLLVAIVFTGAGFGYWMVRRFILSKDGSVDAGIAQFVKWAMRVVATLFMMQSTLDPLLALVALAFSWWLCSLLTAKKVQKTMTQKQKQSMVLSHQMLTQGLSKSPKIQFLSPSKIGFGRTTSRSSATQYGRSNLANGGLVCSALTKHVVPNEDDEDHYSTFHNIQPRKYSKEEWEDFTQKSTRKALAECTATPEFAQWVADNAHRLQVEKEEDNFSEEETIESSNSSEETGDEADGAPGLIRLWG